KRRRRRLRREVIVENWNIAVDPAASPAEQALRRQATQQLETLIADLPDRFRAPLLLHFFHEMTHQEIGLALGVPTSTVSDRIRRALGKLQPRARRLGLSETITASLLAGAVGHLMAPPSTMAATGVFQAASQSIGGSASAAVIAGAAKPGFLSSLAISKGT